MDRRIVGIYKKPNSDKLYAATKYDLYEITPDTTVTLKHLPLDPDIFDWFPLQLEINGVMIIPSMVIMILKLIATSQFGHNGLYTIQQ